MPKCFFFYFKTRFYSHIPLSSTKSTWGLNIIAERTKNHRLHKFRFRSIFITSDIRFTTRYQCQNVHMVQTVMQKFNQSNWEKSRCQWCWFIKKWCVHVYRNSKSCNRLDKNPSSNICQSIFLCFDCPASSFSFFNVRNKSRLEN